MPTNFYQAAAYLALVHKHGKPVGTEVAIGFDADGAVVAIATSDMRSTYDSRSAMVNLLQNTGWSWCPYVSYTIPPSERDLGIARMGGVIQITYAVDDSTLKSVDRYNASMGTKWSKPKAPVLVGRQFNFENFDAPADLKPATVNTWYTDTVLPNVKAQANQNANRKAAPPVLQKITTSYATALGKASTHFDRVKTKLSLPEGLAAGPGRETTDVRNSLFLALTWAIVGEALPLRGADKTYPKGHSIGSVLRGPKDEILGWGLNTNGEQWTLHGEVNLIQIYQNLDAVAGKEVGNGNPKPILYTTLEPCFMCAGMYYESGDKHLTCIYGQGDKGISGNSLSTANRGLQTFVDSAFGTLLTDAIAADLNQQQRTTDLLNHHYAIIVSNALEKYFEFVPDAPQANAQASATRTAWTSGTNKDKTVWENGLKLLNHINPGVKAKWQAVATKYYEGVI